jgi:hemoglobin
MEQTLFDKYGGVPAVTLIVRDFYKRVMKRPNLRRYFDGADMEHLIMHQVAFVAMAMGKTPAEYAGRNMSDAHGGLNITSTSFDLTAELLRDSLVAAKVETADIDAIIAKVSSLKQDIVGR